MMTNEKRCSACGVVKPLTEFSMMTKRGQRVPRSWCKECCAEAQRARKQVKGEDPVLDAIDEHDKRAREEKYRMSPGQREIRESKIMAHQARVAREESLLVSSGLGGVG